METESEQKKEREKKTAQMANIKGKWQLAGPESELANRYRRESSRDTASRHIASLRVEARREHGTAHPNAETWAWSENLMAEVEEEGERWLTRTNNKHYSYRCL